MRNYLFTRSEPKFLMYWCIIILGVRLFLRIEEILKIQIESFQQHFCVVRGKKILSLCICIKGKTDRDDKFFQIYDDMECPEFGAVRPLLLFIAATGRKGGYVFPKLTQIFDETPTDRYEYENALNDIRYLYHVILGKTTKPMKGRVLKIGTHCFRKTAYLIAYWGKKTEIEN